MESILSQINDIFLNLLSCFRWRPPICFWVDVYGNIDIIYINALFPCQSRTRTESEKGSILTNGFVKFYRNSALETAFFLLFLTRI